MMNQEDIFKKIGQILNELNEQYQYLAQNPGELNELELELFLANSSFLSDHVQIVRKLNSKSSQKALPEHAVPQDEMIEQQPVIPVKIIDEQTNAASLSETHSLKPVIEEEIFKIDKEPSTFEFILNDKPSSDKFEFEEKSIDEIFDRPLSKEEAQIIAQKQKLRELDSLESELPEEDEIGPEPFLVSEPFKAEVSGIEVTEDENFVAGTADAAEEENDNAAYLGESAAHTDPAEENENTFGEYKNDETSEDGVEEVAAESNPEQDLIEEEVKEDHPETVFGTQSFTAVPPVEPVKEPEPATQPDFLNPQVMPEEKEPAPVKQSELFSEVKSVAENPVSPFSAPAAPVQHIPVAAVPNISEEQPKAKPTLNDILSGNTGTKTFHHGSGRMPVSDLKQAISLNDKMRYIKDLFNGYNLAYAEAIDLLNKMPDFKTADAFLQNNYAVKNNWASKQDTVDQFYELLNQRFPAK